WQPATAVSAGQPYVFLAGEAGLVRAMRRLAVDAAGVPKEAVAFMGYWRRGAAEC
ncbi:siderophore-interacting protein, partial [Dietzia sp. DQ11-71]|nr:siderophore-interacting protein [Dietzia sp. DQ11-71]